MQSALNLLMVVESLGAASRKDGVPLRAVLAAYRELSFPELAVALVESVASGALVIIPDENNSPLESRVIVAAHAGGVITRKRAVNAAEMTGQVVAGAADKVLDEVRAAANLKKGESLVAGVGALYRSAERRLHVVQAYEVALDFTIRDEALFQPALDIRNELFRRLASIGWRPPQAEEVRAQGPVLERQENASELAEDKELREEGESYAHANGEDFCRSYQGPLERLITTYSDADAREQLNQLREKFWSRTWETPMPATEWTTPEKADTRAPTVAEMEEVLGDKDEGFSETTGTVRRCLDCKAPVAGGPTRCDGCAAKTVAKSSEGAVSDDPASNE